MLFAEALMHSDCRATARSAAVPDHTILMKPMQSCAEELSFASHLETRTVHPPRAVPLTIDRSCWLSWTCYVAGFGAACALNPGMVPDLCAGGAGLWLMLGAVIGFLMVVASIQRHMRLSLLANTFGTPNCLIAGGVFRYSRNPIYVAFLLPLASLAWYAPLAAMTAIALYMWTMTRWVIATEERQLQAQFGAAYTAYRAATPRWL